MKSATSSASAISNSRTVTCPLDPDTPVVTAVATRAIVEEAPEVEAVEGETPEGDEAPGEQTEA